MTSSFLCDLSRHSGSSLLDLRCMSCEDFNTWVNDLLSKPNLEQKLVVLMANLRQDLFYYFGGTEEEAKAEYFIADFSKWNEHKTTYTDAEYQTERDDRVQRDHIKAMGQSLADLLKKE